MKKKLSVDLPIRLYVGWYPGNSFRLFNVNLLEIEGGVITWFSLQIARAEVTLMSIF